MTAQPDHHPNPETLLSYVAGTLQNSISCVVACHAVLCSQCAEEIRWLEKLGGLMLGRVEPEATDVARLEAMAERMATETLPLPLTNGPHRREPDPVLPPPLAHYLELGIGEIPWKTVVKGVRQHWVKLPQGSGQIRLLRLAPGKVLLEHTHTGMELTMVLKGIYGDHSGDYNRGDVIEWTEGSDHQPHAGGTEDCVCMIATESAPYYHRLFARLLRPILGF
jgi:putative transcriptional regulator